MNGQSVYLPQGDLNFSLRTTIEQFLCRISKVFLESTYCYSPNMVRIFPLFFKSICIMYLKFKGN